MKIIYPIITAILITGFNVAAQEKEQEFEGFMNDIHDEFNKAREHNKKEFDAFIKDINNEYSTFLEQEEKRFVEMLLQGFEELNIDPGKSVLNNKIMTPPGFKKESIITEEIEGHLLPVAPARQKEIQLFPGEKEDNTPQDTIHVHFFGIQGAFTFPVNILSLDTLQPVNPKKIGRLYRQMLLTPTDQMITDLLNFKSKYNLNDWGFYLLLQEFTGKLPLHMNNQRFLAWYMMQKCTYKVKLGYADDVVHLMPAVEQEVYEVPRLYRNGQAYYIFNDDVKQMITYKDDYFNANYALDLNHTLPLYLPHAVDSVMLSFEYRDTMHHFTIHYNPQLVSYFKAYPRTELSVYFTTPVSGVFKESVGRQLAPLLKGMTKEEALDFILRFIRHTFSYETDMEQFGRERVLFPEELFALGKGDCEDRSNLFLFLVRELIGLDGIILSYDKHVCCAVEYNQPGRKGTISHHGKKYLVCDPTYENAPPGFMIPGYEKESVNIIDPSFFLDQYATSRDIWQRMAKHDLYSLSRGNNVLVMPDQKFIFTGVHPAGSINEKTGCQGFLSCADENYEIRWNTPFKGAGLVGGCALGMVDHTIYVLGTYSGQLNIGQRSLSLKKHSGPGFFLAGFNMNGHCTWLKDIPVSPECAESGGLMAKVTPQGEFVYLKPVDEFPVNNHYLVNTDEKGNCYLKVRLFENDIHKKHARQWNGQHQFNLVSLLVDESEKMIARQVKPGISILYSLAGNLLGTNLAITGKELQKTVRFIDEKLIQNNNLLYQNIGKISTIQSFNNIFTLNTTNRCDVFINPVRAKHNSRMKVNKDQEKLIIDTLSGMMVGNPLKWYGLNRVEMEKNSGEIMYFYDNYYRKSMPVYSKVLN